MIPQHQRDRIKGFKVQGARDIADFLDPAQFGNPIFEVRSSRAVQNSRVSSSVQGSRNHQPRQIPLTNPRAAVTCFLPPLLTERNFGEIWDSEVPASLDAWSAARGCV